MTTNSSVDIGSTAITTLGTITTGVWNGSFITGTYGGTGVNNGASTITIGGNVSTAGAFTMLGAHSFSGTLTADTSITYPTSGTLVNTGVTTLSSLVSIGTITTGVWNGTVVNGTYGGTGVNNGTNTITLGGNILTAGAHTLSGAFASTFNFTGATNVTFPTSGTLSTTTGTVIGTQVAIDFGSTPQWFAEFTITDAAVSSSSILIGMISYSVGSTGKSLDEISMDTYCVICQPGSGQLIARVTGLEGPLANKFMLNYMRG